MDPNIAMFSPTPTVVTMKLGDNVQSVTSYLLVNFELYEAITAWERLGATIWPTSGLVMSSISVFNSTS